MNLQLKRLRQEKGLSQDEMALKLSEVMGCEMKVSRYGTWERGDRMLNLEQAYYCCVALGCTLNDLVGMESASTALSTDERQLVDDYRQTHDYFKPEISDYAARQAERHPKNEAHGDAGAVAGEAV